MNKLIHLFFVVLLSSVSYNVLADVTPNSDTNADTIGGTTVTGTSSPGEPPGGLNSPAPVGTTTYPANTGSNSVSTSNTVGPNSPGMDVTGAPTQPHTDTTGSAVINGLPADVNGPQH